MFGVLTAREFSEFDELNSSTRTDGEDALLDELRESGESYALATDVLLFSGLACAIATLVLAFFTDFEGSNDTVPVDDDDAPQSPDTEARR